MSTRRLINREWVRAALLLVLGGAGLCLVGSLVLGALWARSAYTGDWEIGAFFDWLRDPANRKDLEPLIGFLGLVSPLLMALAAWLRSRLPAEDEATTEVAGAKAARPGEWERIRSDLIRTVHSHWVKDFLEHSLPGGHRLHLGMEAAPEAIEHPLHVERMGKAGSPELMKRSRLGELFDQSGGLFLILGEPGSGKTITLAQLAELLLERATKDPAAPVPVVALLSSWAQDRRPLREWLGPELRRSYGLSADWVTELLAAGRLILLLDGLDEMKADAREACRAEILRCREQGGVRLAVCCRTEEYAALAQKFTLGEAIRILPLTPGQVQTYVAAWGDRLGALRQAVAEDAELHATATTPLMLNLLAVVYAEGVGAGYNGGTPRAPGETWRHRIFGRYVRLMFVRRRRKDSDGQSVPDPVRYTEAQAVHWLQQIARHLKREGRTEFYIEGLQPAWVSGWLYRLGANAICGSILAILVGVVFELVTGLVLGLWLFFTKQIRLAESRSMVLDRRYTVFSLGLGVLVGVPLGGLFFISGFLLSYYNEDLAFIWGLVGVISGGLGGCVIATLIFTPNRRKMEAAPRSPGAGLRNAWRNCFYGIGIGLGIGTLLSLGLRCSEYLDDLNFMFPVVTFYVPLFVTFVRFGGVDLIRHYTLRLTLAWEGTLPSPWSDRRLIAFLDAMSARLLLTRVGGGWVFRHRLLLEYLADEPFGPNPAAIASTLAGSEHPRRDGVDSK